MVFVTHPKTGTAATSCVVETLEIYLRRKCKHAVMSSYVNENVTGPVIGYYLSMAKALAYEQFREVHAPSLMLRTGSAPFEVCYDAALREADTHNLYHASVPDNRPGRICDAECPCTGNSVQCLSLGHCFGSEPFSRLLWVHVIRHPVDVVISLYKYHLKDPPEELWLQDVGVTPYALYLADNGVDNNTLEKIGVYTEASEYMNYHDYLRNATLEDGLTMEFLRSSLELWKMARLHRRMSRLPERSITIRFEDLATAPTKSWKAVFSAIGKSCLHNMTAFEDFLTKRCGSDNWGLEGSSRNASTVNQANDTRDISSSLSPTGSVGVVNQSLIATPRDDESGVMKKTEYRRLQLQGAPMASPPDMDMAGCCAEEKALLSHPYILSQICDLERILGYSKYSAFCL